jgi:hypothetical protein
MLSPDFSISSCRSAVAESLSRNCFREIPVAGRAEKAGAGGEKSHLRDGRFRAIGTPARKDNPPPWSKASEKN